MAADGVTVAVTRGRGPLVWTFVVVLAACTPSAPSTPSSLQPPPISTGTHSPPHLPVAPSIHVPSGFQAYVYGRGLDRPTAIAFGPDGGLYVTELSGRIVALPSPGSPPEVLVDGLNNPLGLVWRNRELFVSVKGRVLAYRFEGNQLTGGAAVVQGLPFGRYQNDNLILLPNGDFLLGVGATCDVCRERDSRSGTILRFRKDWSYAGIVMRGLHNPYGLALRRSNGAAYITINGQDNLGPNEPADHMLRVVNGLDAGWPRCWPSAQDGTLHGDCHGVARPIALFAAHTSADGFAFYDGSAFPPEYRDNAFVAEWGEVAATGTIGRRVVRVSLTGSKNDERGTVTDFATGFDRPLAVTVTPDGGLLVADFASAPRTGQIIEIRPGP